MDFVPLFSGSSGNSTYIHMDGTRLLVDAGVSGARISAELEKLNVSGSQLSGLLVTHEHADHVSGIGILSRRYGLPIYATQGTWDAMAGKIGKIAPNNRRVITADQDFYVGDVSITPFSIPHDAAQPVGYAFCARGIRAAIATDLGHIAASWLDTLAGCDLIILEANHDIDMLKAGLYPYELKRRILGRNGHLSNEDAGKAAVALARQGVRRILLGHLSQENNFPELAYQSVSQALEEEGLRLAYLEVARWDRMTGIYHLDGEEIHGSR